MRAAEIEANLSKTFIVIKSGEKRKMVIEGRKGNEELWEGYGESGGLLVVSEDDVISLIGPDDSVDAEVAATTTDHATESAPEDNDAAATNDEIVASVGAGDPNAGDAVDAEADTDGAAASDTASSEAVASAKESSQFGTNEDKPNKNWSLPRLAQFILGTLRRTTVDAWWIGQALHIAHERHKENRDWLSWLTKIGISKSTAYRYLDLFDGYSLQDIEERPGVGVCELLDELKDDADDLEDDDDGEKAEEDNNLGNEDEGKDDDLDDEDDLNDDEDDGSQRHVAKKNGKQKKTATGAGSDDDEEKEQSPVNEIESNAFAEFVAAVGGAKRARFVFETEIEHYEDLTTDGD
jgi:hypothetical protein